MAGLHFLATGLLHQFGAPDQVTKLVLQQILCPFDLFQHLREEKQFRRSGPARPVDNGIKILVDAQRRQSGMYLPQSRFQCLPMGGGVSHLRCV